MKYLMYVLIVFTFIINNVYADSTFYDKKTQLTWEDIENKKDYTYESEFFSVGAFEYCEELELDNYTDWRLPSVKEIMTIVDIKRHSPAVVSGIKHINFEDINNDNHKRYKKLYFTSDVIIGDKDYDHRGLRVDFQDGSITKSLYYLEKNGYVKCVRGNKK